MDSRCVKCQKFFGSPEKLNMCSVCFKQHQKENNISEEIKNISVSEQPIIVKQADHNKCYRCNKKIGLLGFKCTVCDCSYCKHHRLPEDHECNIDYRQIGKKQLQKKAQAVIAPKVQQI